MAGSVGARFFDFEIFLRKNPPHFASANDREPIDAINHLFSIILILILRGQVAFFERAPISSLIAFFTAKLRNFRIVFGS